MDKLCLRQIIFMSPVKENTRTFQVRFFVSLSWLLFPAMLTHGFCSKHCVLCVFFLWSLKRPGVVHISELYLSLPGRVLYNTERRVKLYLVFASKACGVL